MRILNKGAARALIALLMVLTLPSVSTKAQISIKNNLVYDATTTPNLGVEVGIARRNTLQLFYGLNPWQMKDDRRMKHWSLMPEYRWWFCSKFNGHFLGLHAMGGQFYLTNLNAPVTGYYFGGDNIAREVRDKSYEGWFAGIGITYGYQWILSRHWNIEAEIGVGYAHAWFDKYNCSTCGVKLPETNTNYVGLTKLGLSVIYLF